MADRVNSLLADLAHCSGDHSCELCSHCDNGNFMCIDNLAADAADVLQEYVDRCARYADGIMALREKQQWISVTERLPETEDFVLAVVNGKPTENVTLVDSIEIASFMRDEGWCLDMYPEWEDPKVTHWMPLPYKPEVTCDG